MGGDAPQEAPRGSNASGSNPLGLDQFTSCGAEQPAPTPITPGTGPQPAEGNFVRSVNGDSGPNVILKSGDIEESDNKYFTDKRAQDAIDVVAPIGKDADGKITHDKSGITAKQYGSTTKYPIIKVDEFGHITAATEADLPDGQSSELMAILEALTGTGYLAKTGVNTWALKTMKGTANAIDVVDGDPLNKQTTINLAKIIAPDKAKTYGSATKIPKVTLDVHGRVTGIELVDIELPEFELPEQTLGNLTNVDDTADLPDYINSVLLWDGERWIPGLPGNSIIEYGTITDFPDTGEKGKIYVAIDTGEMYGWINDEYGQLVNTRERIKVYPLLSDFPEEGEVGYVYIEEENPTALYTWSGVTYTKSGGADTVVVQSDWDEEDTELMTFIQNKPDLSLKADVDYVDPKFASLNAALLVEINARTLSYNALTSSLANKVDKITGEGLSPEKFTLGEKQKLAGLEGPKWQGTYVTKAALDLADVGGEGHSADVDAGAGDDVQRWIWDISDSKWTLQAGTSVSETAASVKAKYESNPDTNVFDDAGKTNLATAITWGNHASAGYLTAASPLAWGNLTGVPNLTTQGNTFNGISQLVQLTADGKYPALDGSLITNLPGGSSLPSMTGNTGKFLTNDGTTASWGAITGWNTAGNSGTSAGTNFIGTTDNVDFVIKRSSVEKMRVTASSIKIPNDVSLLFGDQFSIIRGSGGYVNITGTTYPLTILGPGSCSISLAGGNATLSSSVTARVLLNNVGFSRDATNMLNSIQPYSAGSSALRLFMKGGDGHSTVNYNNRAGDIFVIGGRDYFSNGDGHVIIQHNGTSASTGLVGIGTNSPNTSAILDITSTTKGFLPPRMSTSDWNSIATKAEGLQGWNTTEKAQLWYDGTGTIGFKLNRATNKFQAFDGTSWVDLN